MLLRLVLVLIGLSCIPAVAKYEHFVQGEIKVPEGINRSLKQRGLDLQLLVFAGLGDFNKVQELLEAGANPNAKDQYDVTALYWAAHSGHPEIVNLLMQQGADKNAHSVFGERISHWAINEKVKRVLNVRPYTLLIDNHNREHCISCYYGFFGFWEDQNEIELNRQLNQAVIHLRDNKVIRRINSLINAGANTGVVNRNIHITTNARSEEHLIVDDTPLHLAISNSNVNGVRALLRDNGYTHFLKRQFLLRREDDDVEYKISIESPFHLVKYGGSSDDMTILRMLLEANEHVDVNIRNHNGQTPIYQAVERENIEAIDLLLSYNAEVNISDHKGITPLHLAAIKNNFALVSKFVELGTNLNARNYRGKMPSQVTTDLEIERWLLAQGTSSYATFDELSLIYEKEMSQLSFKDKKRFMLFASVKYGSLDAIQKALEGFSSVAINEMKDISGRSLLHWAVIRDDFEVIKLLTERDLDLFATDMQNKMPISEARSVASLLLLHKKMYECVGVLVAR